MSFIGSLLSRVLGDSEGEPAQWLPTSILPASPADLALAMESPGTRARVFLLHDRRCPVSKHAYQEACGVGGEIHVIDVSDSHEVGREVEELVGIRHESPQVMIISNGGVTWHASHWDITLRGLQDALREVETGE